MYPKSGNYFNGNHEMDFLRLQLVELQALCNEDRTHLHGDWQVLFTSEQLERKNKEFHEKNKHCYRGVCVRQKKDGKEDKDGLIALLTAGTRPKDCDRASKGEGNIMADIKVACGDIPEVYCRSGEFFFEFVCKEFGMPHLIVGHSLGCAFNVWSNAKLAGSTYVLNIDSPINISHLQGKVWAKFQGAKPRCDDHIDTILGSPNVVDNGPVEWLPKGVKHYARKIFHREPHLGHVFEVRSKDYGGRHAVASVLCAFQHEFALHYTSKFSDKYIKKNVDGKEHQERILGVRHQFRTNHGSLLKISEVALSGNISMMIRWSPGAAARFDLLSGDGRPVTRAERECDVSGMLNPFHLYAAAPPAIEHKGSGSKPLSDAERRCDLSETLKHLPPLTAEVAPPMMHEDYDEDNPRYRRHRCSMD